MNSTRPKNPCRCGRGTLRWEQNGHRWLATCSSPDCGEITLPPDTTYQLPAFLGATPRPARPPWIRLFEQAGRIDGLAWTNSPQGCAACDRPDLVFNITLSPVQDPWQAWLCINCGAVLTWSVSGDRGCALHGGDWETFDDAVLTLRKGIRERAQLDESDLSEPPWRFG